MEEIFKLGDKVYLRSEKSNRVVRTITYREGFHEFSYQIDDKKRLITPGNWRGKTSLIANKDNTYKFKYSLNYYAFRMSISSERRPFRYFGY